MIAIFACFHEVNAGRVMCNTYVILCFGFKLSKAKFLIYEFSFFCNISSNIKSNIALLKNAQSCIKQELF